MSNTMVTAWLLATSLGFTISETSVLQHGRATTRLAIALNVGGIIDQGVTS